MGSIYHILDKVPAIDKAELQIEYEELAQGLVASGKLRIDTDNTSNFARYVDSNVSISLIVSKEELENSVLLLALREKLENLYQNSTQAARKIEQALTNLTAQINKLQPVNSQTSLKLARLFVQAAHPIVIKWLLLEGAEVFITYSHNIGDMMDIENWQTSGSNSGMQSTDGQRSAIFVSCGGDPLAPNDEYGNGWAAIARLQIIAGQELGHFADIKRDARGEQITRHSANFSGTRAKENVRLGRLADLKKCHELRTLLTSYGLTKLTKYEQELKFYQKNKLANLKILKLKIDHFIAKHKLLAYAHRQQLHFIKRFAKDQYMGLMIGAMLEDMKFNLAPVADVYKRTDAVSQEAIACVEALARVPQQVNKWGYLTTKEAMPNLYKIYFTQVIPSLIDSYQAITGKQYKRNYDSQQKFWWQKIFTKKQDKTILKSIRDI